ncbi:hypothetical protein [Levilactobacillus spicheri]|uniref:Beta-carotene 15,15'-monooxygenase n=2 Tax=Levilactobacillus spicheri TaxID=216463 RepID=A0A0F3RP77_9LACO|nr:hypothetical protein [Levilactobacillus spicheri]KJW11808.1 hypothetical protein VC81_11280 [Levilactobacillus spicheri]KRL46742.1 hypothetical protein FD37_GL000213 [Levilactobacillus spicheri DSM 15429]GEO66739.1 hypothetical protein LSP04_11580 [Levilactobacillus spicheri]
MMKYSDGPIATSLGVLWDYVVLTAMLIIISLPIVTIGCTFHATLRVINKFRVTGHSENVSPMFFRYLREQWLWYTVTFVVGVMSVSTSLINLKNLASTSLVNVVLGSLMLILAILVAGIWFCIQVIGVYEHTKPVESLKTALVFFVLNLPKNLGMLILTVGLCYVLAVFPLSFPVDLILLDFVWKRYLGSARPYIQHARQVITQSIDN